MGKIITLTEDEAKNYFETKEHKENLKKLKKIKDEDIDYSDIPEITPEFWKTAKMIYPVEKEKISIRLDKDVLDFLKKTGKGYQTTINTILRTYYEAHR